MSIEGLTGVDALEAEMRDRLAAKNVEIDRLRAINADLLAVLEAIAACDEDDLPALCDIEMSDLALRALDRAKQ